jgi:hypothetical protein
MKNLFRPIIIVAVCAAMASCMGKTSSEYTLTASLEEFALAQYNDYFNETDSTFSGAAYILMDNISFLCAGVDEQGFHGGFALSKKKAYLTSEGAPTMTTSAGGKGGSGRSVVYSYFYQNPNPSFMPEYDIRFNFANATTYTCFLKGAAVNNTAHIASLVASGYFMPGDYYKVVATGYNQGKPVGTSEFYLVDYTGNELKAVSDWAVWKMDSITGIVDAVKFDIQSSRAELPLYFCMDNFTVDISFERKS